MEGLTLSSGLAGLAIMVGLVGIIGSLVSGRSSHQSGRSTPSAATQPEPAPTTAASAALHESWSLLDPEPPGAQPTKQAVTQRRAEVLTGLQLVLLAVVLLIGGLVFTRVIVADELPIFLWAR